MKNLELDKIIIIMILVFMNSCKQENKTEKKLTLIPNELKQSFSFKKVKNQNDSLSNFIFGIDTLDNLKDLKYYKNIEFYKLNLTDCDSLYLGKRNDTIFTYYRNIDFAEVFLILNKREHTYMGRIGNSFWVELINSTDSTFHFSLKELKKSDFDDDFVYIFGTYPEKTISEITTSLNGKIIDIKIKDRSLNN